MGETWKKLIFFNPFLSSLLKLHLIRKHFWDAKGDHGQQWNGITSEMSCSKWQHTAEHGQHDHSLPLPAAAGNVKPYLEYCKTDLALGHRSGKGWAGGEGGQNLTEAKQEKETARRKKQQLSIC